VRTRSAKAMGVEGRREVDGPAQAVVVGVGRRRRGGVFRRCPVEGVRVGDDAADGGAVSVQPLGERVDDKIAPRVPCCATGKRGVVKVASTMSGMPLTWAMSEMARYSKAS
jgi:hypothetical protein